MKVDQLQQSRDVDLRPQQERSSQPAHIEPRCRITSGRIRSNFSEIRREQQGTHALERQRPLRPSHQLQRIDNHGERRQRSATGKLPRRGRKIRVNRLQLRCQHFAEHALKLFALLRKIRHQHRHAGALALPFARASRNSRTHRTASRRSSLSVRYKHRRNQSIRISRDLERLAAERPSRVPEAPSATPAGSAESAQSPQDQAKPAPQACHVAHAPASAAFSWPAET